MHTFLYVHCNSAVSKTNWVGNYCEIESWLERDKIAKIFSGTVLKRLGYRNTYDSDDGYYEVSKGDIVVKFYKYEQYLPYIHTSQQGVILLHTVWQK